MTAVYIVTHAYELDGCEESKIIGAYATLKDARLAVRRKRRYPGFCDHPKGFHIDCYELGRDQWSEGFVTVPARKKKQPSSAKSRLKSR
jgi:hypothetical protein